MNREPNLAFDLVTRRDYLVVWDIVTLNVVLTFRDPPVKVGLPDLLCVVDNCDVLKIPPVYSTPSPEIIRFYLYGDEINL